MSKKTEKQQPATAKKDKTPTRFDAATQVVRELTDAATLEEVNAAADALFVKHGGESNPAKARSHTKWAVQLAKKFGLIEVERTVTVTIRPATKG